MAKKSKAKRRQNKRKSSGSMLHASGPADTNLRFSENEVELLAAAVNEDGEQESGPRRFRMLAYSGGKMDFGSRQVVVDLAGLKASAKNRPILRDHDASKIVGHSKSVKNDGRQLIVDGVMSAQNSHSEEVLKASESGFPWQSSVGVRVEKIQNIAAGNKVTINGQSFDGPLSVVRAGHLKEVSFVALGADDRTSALTAMLEDQEPMNEFEKWLVAQGFAEDQAAIQALAAKLLERLKAQFEAETSTETQTETATTVTATAATTETVETDSTASDSMIEAAIAKQQRIASANMHLIGHTDLYATALNEEWSEAQIVQAASLRKLEKENAELKAKAEDNSAADVTVTYTGPAIGSPELVHAGAQAAIMLTAGLGSDEDEDKTLQSAGFSEEEIKKGKELFASKQGGFHLEDALHATAMAAGKPLEYSLRGEQLHKEHHRLTATAGLTHMSNGVNRLMRETCQRRLKALDAIADSNCIQRFTTRDTVPCPDNKSKIIDLALKGEPTKVPKGGTRGQLEMSHSEFESYSEIYGDVIGMPLSVMLCMRQLNWFQNLPQRYQRIKEAATWAMLCELFRNMEWQTGVNHLTGADILCPDSIGELKKMKKRFKTSDGLPVGAKGSILVGDNDQLALWLAQAGQRLNGGSNANCELIPKSPIDKDRTNCNPHDGFFGSICDTDCWLDHCDMGNVLFCFPSMTAEAIIEMTYVTGYEGTQVEEFQHDSTRIGSDLTFTYSGKPNQICENHIVAIDPDNCLKAKAAPTASAKSKKAATNAEEK